MGRADRDIGDVVVISSVADASPKAYPLARIPNNVSYETVSEDGVESNQRVVIPLSFHDGLGYGDYGKNSGSIINLGLLTARRNVIEAARARNTVTLTGAANPPNYFFETVVNDSGADDGQPVLYIIANESAEVNIYKISLDSGDFGTLLNTKTQSITPTQPMGRPAEWNDGSNTYWRLGLGDTTNDFTSLTSIASGTAADTWSSGTDADARHLHVVGNQLIRSTGANEISILPKATDPETEANWGGNFLAGDASTKITELGEASGLGYIAKEDGFYEWDLVGEADNIFPEIGNAPRNGQGMVYWHGGFLIPAATGLWWTRTGEPVGPDSNPNNHSNAMSGSGAVILHGRWMGLAAYGAYIYGVYVDSTGILATILYGRERDDSDPPGWGPIIWHSIGVVTADLNDFHGISIVETSEFASGDVRPSLWAAHGNNVVYFWLDRDGAPMSRRGDIEVIGNSVLDSGVISQIDHQFHKIDGWAEDMQSGHSMRFAVAMDGGSFNNVGATITTDGYFQRFWTQDSNDTGRTFAIKVSWIASDNLTGTNGPRLENTRLHMVSLPSVTREWTFLFDVEDNGKTAKKKRSELEAFVGDLKKYKLPDGDTFNGVMGKIRMLRADEISALTPRNQEPPTYVMAAPVREVSGS